MWSWEGMHGNISVLDVGHCFSFHIKQRGVVLYTTAKVSGTEIYGLSPYHVVKTRLILGSYGGERSILYNLSETSTLVRYIGISMGYVNTIF